LFLINSVDNHVEISIAQNKINTQKEGKKTTFNWFNPATTRSPFLRSTKMRGDCLNFLFIKNVNKRVSQY